MRTLANAINGRLPGFALMEMILVIAITSIVMVGLTAVLYQLINNREHAQNSMLSSEQARNAHYWLSRDSMMSQTVEFGDNPDTPENEVLYLIWVGSERRDEHDNEYADLYDVTYFYENDEIRRLAQLTTGVYDSEGALIEMNSSNTTTLIAQGITDLMISSDNHTLNFSLTANYEDVETAKSFEVTQRTIGNF